MGRVHGELLHTLITITSVPTQFSTSTHNHDEVQHSRFRCYAPRSTSPLSSHRHQIRSAQGRMGKCRLSQGHRRESRALSSSSWRLGERRLPQGNWREPRALPTTTNGRDTGIGFKLAQIEANPAGFFTDAHTNLFPLGVVRGQLAWMIVEC